MLAHDKSARTISRAASALAPQPQDACGVGHSSQLERATGLWCRPYNGQLERATGTAVLESSAVTNFAPLIVPARARGARRAPAVVCVGLACVRTGGVIVVPPDLRRGVVRATGCAVQCHLMVVPVQCMPLAKCAVRCGPLICVLRGAVPPVCVAVRWLVSLVAAGFLGELARGV